MNIDDLPTPDYTSLSDEELLARISELRMKRRQVGVQVKKEGGSKPKKQRQEARGFTPEQARSILAALMASGQLPTSAAPTVEEEDEDNDEE